MHFHQQSLQDSLTRIRKNQEELDKAEQTVNQLSTHSDTDDDVLAELYKERESVEKGVNEVEKAYYQSRGIIDKTEKESKEIGRQRESAES
jgi:chromosome segregation protein